METRAPEITYSPPLGKRRLASWCAMQLAIERGHLFSWSAVCLGAGVAIFFALKFEPSSRHITVLALVSFFACLLAWLTSWRLGPLFGAIALICAGVVIAALRTQYVAAPQLDFRYYGPIEGRIIAIDRSHSNKTRLTLDQVRLDRMDPVQTPRRVRISLHGDQPFLVPETGAWVAVTGHLSPPSGPVEPGGFDFQRHAFFQGLGALGYTRSPALLLRPPGKKNIAQHLYSFRKSLSAGLKTRMDDREGPFAAAIITGDRTDLDKEALEHLRGSNLAHLLAISGLHMGLLTGAVLALTRILLACWPVTITWLPAKKIAALVALLAATVYLGISGASVATQRAYVMAVVMLVALCLDRRAITMRAVTVATLIVLIVRPESLVGPGFQMSFAATIALVAVFAFLRDGHYLLTLPGWSKGLITLAISSAVAGFATAPFGAAHFNQMAHYGLIANLVSVPVMGIVVMPGAILAAMLWPIGLEGLGLFFMHWGLHWIFWVAEMVSTQPGAVRLISAPSPTVLPLVAFGGLMLCLMQSKLRLLSAIPLAVAAHLWSTTARPDVLISESGLLIGVLGPEGRVVNKAKGDGFTADSWLENDGDGAQQMGAHERGDLDRKRDEITLGTFQIGYNMEKELSLETLKNLCEANDLIVVPNVPETSLCLAVTRDYLRQEGSVAVTKTDDGLRVKTTNAHRGARIWIP